MRMINGQIFLGQDKSLDENIVAVKCAPSCQLNNIRQGCDFTCTCGAEAAGIDKYGQSFVPQEGEYTIYTLDMAKKPMLIYLGSQSLDESYINRLDAPIVCHHFMIDALNCELDNLCPEHLLNRVL